MAKKAEKRPNGSNRQNGLQANKTKKLFKMDTIDKMAILPKWPEWRKRLQPQKKPKWFKSPE